MSGTGSVAGEPSVDTACGVGMTVVKEGGESVDVSPV